MTTKLLSKKRQAQSGFTLVELAIVLVIIGLLVGGVLVGQDLIKAAEIRATVTQIEQVNAAATTFRTKFNALPGDITPARADQFGLLPTGRNGGAGRGDGNGAITPSNGNLNVLGFEPLLFWHDLSSADLVPSAFTQGVDGAAASITDMSRVLFQTRIRDLAYFHVFSIGGRNYIYIGGFNSTDAAGLLSQATGLQTIEASSIDEKVDDGFPQTGGTGAADALPAATSTTFDEGGILASEAAAAAGVCVATAATGPHTYNVAEAFAQEVNCRLITRASF